jgi:Protein of unknown function (DUF1552)
MRQLNFPISRRTVLRGAGTALALPWLEAMMPAAARGPATKPPVRMAVLYMPNGVHPDLWTPAGQGRDFELSATLEPLRELKDDILVVSNLWNANSVGGDGHYVKNAGFLTSTTITKTLGVEINANGISMDQVAAKRMGRETPLPSLELGTAPVTTGVDKNVGYTRVYGSHIAWSEPTNPLAREINPRTVYERLFRACHPLPDSAKQDVLLLDRVMDDARELRQQLGAADRQRMDEYLSVVRSLEQRLDRSRPGRSAWKPRAPIDAASEPPDDPKEHADRVRWMLDMIAVAFQSDTTRICTFMYANEVSNENFSFVDGVKEGHHSVSHHQRDAGKMRQYQLINRWHIEQYAYLLRKLRSMKEGNTSLLENSMILFGSGIRDGDKHDPHNLPIVVGGRGGRRLVTGQHLVCAKDTPLSNLYLAMLDAFGTPVARFSDSTGPLTEVLS